MLGETQEAIRQQESQTPEPVAIEEACNTTCGDILTSADNIARCDGQVGMIDG